MTLNTNLKNNWYVHAQRSLDDQRHKRDKVHARMVLCDVHDDLEEKRCEGNARTVAEVGKDRQYGDDREYNRAG